MFDIPMLGLDDGIKDDNSDGLVLGLGTADGLADSLDGGNEITKVERNGWFVGRTETEGLSERIFEGCDEGLLEGIIDGQFEGLVEGLSDGLLEGCCEGI